MSSRTESVPSAARKASSARRLAARTAPARTIAIPVRAPFPWLAMLRYLAGRLIPGSERVEGTAFVRADQAGMTMAEIRFDAERKELRVAIGADANARDVEARARRVFVPDHDADAVALLARDPLLAARVRATPGLRPLGCWEPFELCVRTLIGQQVSVRAAQRLTERIVDRCGGLRPDALADAELGRIGMPGRRVAAIQGFAGAVAAGAIDPAAGWSELEPALAALPGFGPWTCAYLGIRLGRDPDAFPAADAGLLRATGETAARSLEKRAEAWRPWRAFAATYLWVEPPADSAAQQDIRGD